MQEKYKVSIVIPVYNVGGYLERTLNSILNQKYNNIELILVNDGSTDNSLSICQDYAAKDSRIVVLSQKNKGASAARNAGIERATGDYLHICDADDIVEGDIYSESMSIAELFYPDVIRFNYSLYSDQKFVRRNIVDYPYETLLEKDYIIREIIPYTIGIYKKNAKIITGHWTLLAKISLIKQNRIRYNENKTKEEDQPFLVNILAYTNSLVFLQGTYYHYMRRSNSLMSRYSPRFQNICDTLKNYEEWFGQYYDFKSQTKIEYNVNNLIECLEYVLIHHKDCNTKEETVKILSSKESQEWFSILTPKTAFQKRLKKCVEQKAYNKGFYYSVEHYYALRTGNLFRKVKGVFLRK